MPKCVPSFLTTCFTPLLFVLFCHGYADTTVPKLQQQFYVAGDLGIFTGNFNANYTDLSDVVAQNIANSSSQNGYSGGIGLGYIATFNHKYFLGAEVVQNFNGNQASFQAGANSTAFSDNVAIRNNLDFLIQPGMMLTDSFAAYLNAGLSIALVNDQLTSPVDSITPAYESYNSQRHITGFALGIGARDYLTKHLSLFTEYNYHDYGTDNFSNFQNFTSTYSHSARITSNAISLGAAWNF